MAVLSVKRPWLQKPRNPRLENSKIEELGLLRFYPFVNDGSPRELVTGDEQNWQISGASVGIADGELSFSTNSTSGYFYTADDEYRSSITNKLTFFVDFVFNGNTSTSDFVFANCSISNSAYNWGIYVTGSDISYVYVKTGGVAVNAVGTALTAGQRYKIFGVYDGANLSIYQYDKFGTLLTTSSTAKTGNVDTTNLNTVFNRWTGSSNLNISVIYAGIANKVWADHQRLEFSRYPSSIFEQRTIYVPLSAGGGTTNPLTSKLSLLGVGI